MIPKLDFGFNFCPRHLSFPNLKEKYYHKSPLSLLFKKPKYLTEFLSDFVDEHTLYFLKGIGDLGILQFQDNKISFAENLNCLNAGRYSYGGDANILALYRFDDSATPASDVMGTYPLSAGAPTFVSHGKSRYGVSLDGVDDYIQNVGTLLDSFPANGTIELWFMPVVNVPAGDYLAHKGNAANSDMLLGNRIFTTGMDFYLYVPTTFYTASTSQTSWLANTWYHIAALWGAANTWGSTGMKIVVNGILDGTNAYTGTIPDGTLCDFTLGAYANPLGNYINAHLDLCRVSSIQREKFKLSKKPCGIDKGAIAEELISGGVIS